MICKRCNKEQGDFDTVSIALMLIPGTKDGTANYKSALQALKRMRAKAKRCDRHDAMLWETSAIGLMSVDEIKKSIQKGTL